MKSFKILITCIMIVLFSSMFLAEGENPPLDLSDGQVQDVGGGNKVSGSGVTVYKDGKFAIGGGNLNIAGKDGNAYDFNGEINGKIGENGVVTGTAGLDGAMIGNDEICSKCTFELDLNSGEFKMTPPDNNDVFFRGSAISGAEGIEILDINNPNSKIQVIGENAMIMDPSGNSFSGNNPTYNPANQKFSGENGYYVGENFDGRKTSDCWGKCTMSFEPMDENVAIGFIESHQNEGSAAVVFNVKDKNGFYHGGRSTTTVERNGLNTKTIIPSHSTMVQRNSVSSDDESINFYGESTKENINNGYVTAEVMNGEGEVEMLNMKVDIYDKKIKFAASGNPFTKPNSNRDLRINEFGIGLNGEPLMNVRNKNDFANFVKTGYTLPEKPVEIKRNSVLPKDQQLTLTFKTPPVVKSDLYIYPEFVVATTDLSDGYNLQLVQESFEIPVLVAGLKGKSYWEVMNGINTIGHQSAILVAPDGNIRFSSGKKLSNGMIQYIDKGAFKIKIPPEDAKEIMKEILNPAMKNPQVKQFLRRNPTVDIK